MMMMMMMMMMMKSRRKKVDKDDKKKEMRKRGGRDEVERIPAYIQTTTQHFACQCQHVEATIAIVIHSDRLRAIRASLYLLLAL